MVPFSGERCYRRGSSAGQIAPNTDLVAEGVHNVTRYEPKMEKMMRMHSVTSTIENGFVHVPAHVAWLPQYLHEMAIFPNCKYDDQGLICLLARIPCNSLLGCSRLPFIFLLYLMTTSMVTAEFD